MQIEYHIGLRTPNRAPGLYRRARNCFFKVCSNLSSKTCRLRNLVILYQQYSRLDMEGHFKQQSNYASRSRDQDEESMQELLGEKSIPKARWFSTEPPNLRKAWVFALIQVILLGCYTVIFNALDLRRLSGTSSLVHCEYFQSP